MIVFKTGNLLDNSAFALVNTVNTVGVMGKGIALQFKQAFPHNFAVYKVACSKGEVAIGKILAVEDRDLFNEKRLIINLPTKTHWRLPSAYSYVDLGLLALRDYISTYNVLSLAIPAPGCGNGGLVWDRVRQMIELHLANLQCEISVYMPVSSN